MFLSLLGVQITYLRVNTAIRDNAADFSIITGVFKSPDRSIALLWNGPVAISTNTWNWIYFDSTLRPTTRVLCHASIVR